MSINSAHGAFEIDGVHTEVVVTEFADRVLVLATQIGKLGTMYLTRDAGPGGGRGFEPPEVRVLVGRREDEMLEATARRLAQVIQARGSTKQVLVSLGLRPTLAVGTLRGVARVAADFACDAMGLGAPAGMGEMSLEA